jgi:hypothetical protein
MPIATREAEIVTFEACKEQLLDKGNSQLQSYYHHWTQRPDVRTEVVPFVQNFTHDFLYQVTRADYEACVRASGHALGDIRSTEQRREIEDFFTPFALGHLFHELVETSQKLPTWEDFATWMKGPARGRYLQPLMNSLGYHTAPQAERIQMGRAIQWRLGKYYYSAMREIELMVRLREEYNIHLKYHILADVLMRVDFWVEHILLCVWFGNSRYRSQTTGRKVKAASYFESPAFTILDVEVDKQGFGNFWRVSDASVGALANVIKNELDERYGLG